MPTLSFAKAGMLGYRLIVSCDPCHREEELPLPMMQGDKPPLGQWGDFAIEDVWRLPGFRCGQCQGRATMLSVQRMLKSGRRWSVVMNLR